MAKEIKNIRNITVITNSLRITNELSGVESIKLITTGGVVSNNQSFVGSLAESLIENNFFAEKVFFSSKGVSPDAGILESNEQECFIKQQMINNATKSISCVILQKLVVLDFIN